MFRSTALVATLLLTPAALAQQDDPPQVRYDPVTEVEFDGVDVSAALTKPGVQILLEVRDVQFNPLFRLRTGFWAELVGSVDEIK